MKIKQYLDSTYLKTNAQSGLCEAENLEVVKAVIAEAIVENFKLVMVRPDRVAVARQMLDDNKSHVLVGTVIDFPDGTGTIEDKLTEAAAAILNGADDLDFVVNYTAFKEGNTKVVEQLVVEGTQLGLKNGNAVKWIIEIAALTNEQIVQLCKLIKNTVTSNFDESAWRSVFVKSSTGFFITENGLPNGATVPVIKLMLAASQPLPVKAAGGVRNYDEAVQMIELGVKRIGTSSAQAIAKGQSASEGY